MRKMGRGTALILALAMLLARGVAESGVVMEAGRDGLAESVSFYTGTAFAGKLLLCDVTQHRYYLYDEAGGARAGGSSVAVVQESEDSKTYCSTLALASDGQWPYAVEMTIYEEEGFAEFQGAGLYRLDALGEKSEKVAELDLSEAIFFDDFGEYCLPCKGALLGEGRLLLLFEEDNAQGMGFEESAGKQRLLVCDLNTGRTVRRELTGATQLIYQEGDTLTYSQAVPDSFDVRLVARSLRKDEEKELFRVPGNNSQYPQSIVYDPEQNELFYCAFNRVWGMRSSQEAPRLVASLPLRHPSAAYFLGKGRLAACTESMAAIVRIDWQYEIETRALVVAGGHIAIEQYATEHPELELLYSNSMSDEEIVHAILTQSPTPDIFTLGTADAGAFAALRERGYLLALEGETLRGLQEKLHPDLMAAVSVDGEICMLPTDMIGQITIGVNERLWRELNLGAMPENWEEMLAFWREWPQSDLADQASLFYGRMDEAYLRERVLIQMVSDYNLYRGDLEQEIGYDTEIFRELISGALEMDFGQLSLEGGEDIERALFSLDCFLTAEEEPSPFSGRPLAVAPGAPRLAPVVLYTLAINPYTRNRDLAMELLAYTSKHLDPVQRLEMMPAENEPIRPEGYEEGVLSTRQAVQDLETRLEICEDETERARLASELERARQRLDALVSDVWRASEESIAQYRENTERIGIVYAMNLNAEDGRALREIFRQFYGSELSLEDFILEMDRRITMRSLEER